MKISELQELLEKAKKEYGDVEIVVYNYRPDTEECVRGLMPLTDQYTGVVSLEIY